jgi:hypothetical protein
VLAVLARQFFAGALAALTEHAPENPAERLAADKPAGKGRGKASPPDGSAGDEEAPDGAPTEDWLALAFARERAEHCRYDHTGKQWLVWDGSRWKRNGDGLVLDWIRELVRRHAAQCDQGGRLRLERANTIRGIEGLAQTDRALAAEETAFDQDPLLLGTPEGTVELRTGRLRPSRPEEMISRACAVVPAAPGTGCPLWLEFLASLASAPVPRRRSPKRHGGGIRMRSRRGMTWSAHGRNTVRSGTGSDFISWSA